MSRLHGPFFKFIPDQWWTFSWNCMWLWNPMTTFWLKKCLVSNRLFFWLPSYILSHRYDAFVSGEVTCSRIHLNARLTSLTECWLYSTFRRAGNFLPSGILCRLRRNGPKSCSWRPFRVPIRAVLSFGPHRSSAETVLLLSRWRVWLYILPDSLGTFWTLLPRRRILGSHSKRWWGTQERWGQRY